MNVLLVDDHTIVRDALRRLLGTFAECRIEEVTSGAQAEARAGQRRFDLIEIVDFAERGDRKFVFDHGCRHRSPHRCESARGRRSWVVPRNIGALKAARISLAVSPRFQCSDASSVRKASSRRTVLLITAEISADD